MRKTMVLATAALLLAACGGTAAPTTTAPSPTTSVPTTAAPTTTTTVSLAEADAALVAVLFDELNAAAAEGPEAALAALVAAAPPGAAPDREHCAWEYGRIDHRAFEPRMETLQPAPDWEPPGGEPLPAGRVYSMMVVLADGEGDDAERATRPAHLVVAGDAAMLMMACAVPPPPPTTTTTTTIPLPPLTVGETGGPEVATVRTELDVDGDAGAGTVSGRLLRMLYAMGADAEDDAAAVLTVDVTLTARGGRYEGGGTCYTGARASGTVTLTLPDETRFTERVSGEVPMPGLTFSCPGKAGAPHQWAFEQAMIEAIVGIWGEGAVPLLEEIVSRERCSVTSSCPSSSTWDYPNRKAALDAFRTLDYGLIHPAVLADFAAATIDMLDLLIEKGWTDHGAKSAARRFLETLSGEDFGGSSADDVEQWRGWLDEWRDDAGV
jgi:hypothetical protein